MFLNIIMTFTLQNKLYEGSKYKKNSTMYVKEALWSNDLVKMHATTTCNKKKKCNLLLMVLLIEAQSHIHTIYIHDLCTSLDLLEPWFYLKHIDPLKPLKNISSNILQQMTLHISSNVSSTTGVTYLVDVTTRSAHECHKTYVRAWCGWLITTMCLW